MSLDGILQKATGEKPLVRDEILTLLNLQKREEKEALFTAARTLRERYFGKSVFLYGFLYVSTYCRNGCSFCHYRAPNSTRERYRKPLPEVLDAARKLEDSGVDLIDITLGEDPEYRKILPEVTAGVRKAVATAIMVSPGVLDRVELREIHAAGADWYACYQETHNRALFSRLRTGQDYNVRLAVKETARTEGLLTEEGILCGAGESAGDTADSISAMAASGCSQLRAMTFVPGPDIPGPRGTGTGLGGIETGLATGESRWSTASPDRELLAIAAMRLVSPARLIPASLDIEGLDGLGKRLDAGANVVTSLIPGDMGFLGVAWERLDIDEGRRSAAGVHGLLLERGLTRAGRDSYREWMNAERHRTGVERCG